MAEAVEEAISVWEAQQSREEASRTWGQLGGAADPLTAFVPLPGGSCETRKAPIILGGVLVMPSGSSGTQVAAHITWERMQEIK